MAQVFLLPNQRPYGGQSPDSCVAKSPSKEVLLSLCQSPESFHICFFPCQCISAVPCTRVVNRSNWVPEQRYQCELLDA